jgi:hypothetical protein
MTHLTDEQLNEVLDDAIFDHSILGHLDACPDCKQRLDEMRALFADIESLPELALPRDLTASVIVKLPAPRTVRPWTWLSAAQAVGAFAILTWLASSFVLPTEIATYQPPTFNSLLASVLQLLSSFTFEAPTFDLKPLTIDLQSTAILAFIVSAAILWLVGNGLLLRTPQRNNQ